MISNKKKLGEKKKEARPGMSKCKVLALIEHLAFFDT